MPVDNAYVVVPAGASTTVVSSKGGVRLGKVIVIGPVSTQVTTIFDSAAAASGPILFQVPIAAPIGTIYPVEIEVINGIVALGISGSTSVNVTYSN